MNQNPTTVSRDLYDSVRQELERVQRVATRYKLEAELWKMILVEDLSDVIEEFCVISRGDKPAAVFVLVKERTQKSYEQLDWFHKAYSVSVLIYTGREDFGEQIRLTHMAYENDLTA